MRLQLQLMFLYGCAASSDRGAIISYLTAGAGQGMAWDRLAEMTDTIGNRLCGSDNYHRAAEYMKEKLREDGLANVHGESVPVDVWVRGQEYATMLKPRHNYKLNILGLGGSIATPREGITAECLVVNSLEDLKSRQAEAEGKIVVFNQHCDWAATPVDCYDATGIFRTDGASHAASYGASAVLVRSLASNTLNSQPHTGMLNYNPNITRIPAAAITVEDALALQRMQDRGQTIIISLYMEAHYVGDENIPSERKHQDENVIAELTGTEKPSEFLIVSGHLDSWDVGVGAMDDGGGAFVAWQALTTLKNLKIAPKRTIRLILWACEEFGGLGGAAYFARHKAELPKAQLVFESDIGSFTPTGIGFTGNDKAKHIIQEILASLKSLNASRVFNDGVETDIEPWCNAGVPCAALGNDNRHYFDFHHSNGDQMTVQSSRAMDLASAVVAVTLLEVANLDLMLPRNPPKDNEDQLTNDEVIEVAL
jgi:carboxypeptidase Q